MDGCLRVEEDRVSEGYENVVEMLEDTGVDTKKVRWSVRLSVCLWVGGWVFEG